MSSRFGFDLGSDETPAVSRVTVFCCGRCLSRIYWHLQQAVLLGSKVDPQDDAERIREQQATHLQNGLQVVDELATRVGSIEFDAADTASRDIRRLVAEWKDSLEPGVLREAVDNATEEFQRQPEEVSPAVYCGELVRDYVDPLHHDLHKLMTAAFPQQLATLFNLGIQCERGICRPDVHRFLTWSDTWPVLTDETASSPPHTSELEEEEDRGHVGVVRDDTTVRPLANRAFATGQLAPQDGWADELRAAWSRAGLPDDDLRASLSQLKQQLSRHTLRPHYLLQSTERMHRNACDLILDRSPTAERVQVDLETNRITVDGTNVA